MKHQPLSLYWGSLVSVLAISLVVVASGMGVTPGRGTGVICTASETSSSDQSDRSIERAVDSRQFCSQYVRPLDCWCGVK